MPDILSLKKITKVYGTEIKTQVLFDINITFTTGEFSAIIGRSGSGKTTLLNILGALDRPTSGEIIAQSRNLSESTDDELAEYRNRAIGFIFQFHHLLPEFTALENVLIPYRIAHGTISPDIEKRARELIERVGCGERMNNRAVNLSGGQQQRIAIARSLINSPQIILADEPTGNLDSEASEEILSLMRSINKEFGTTFVIVTHDRHIAAQCDRLIELKDGRVFRDIVITEKGSSRIWDEPSPCHCIAQGLPQGSCGKKVFCHV